MTSVAIDPACEVVRKVLRISPVEHKIPGWLKEMLQEQFPDRTLQQCGELESRALYEFFKDIDIDHLGTAEWCGIKSCFVFEPYHVKAQDIIRLKEKGRQCGFVVAYDPVSYYYPGASHRVVLFPISVRLTTSSHVAAVLALFDAGGELADT